MINDETIGFLISQQELFHHYEPIWKYLDNFCIFIHGRKEETDLVEEYCEKKSISYEYASEFLKKNKKIPYLVSHQYSGWHKKKYLIKALAKYNVRFMYGLGKEKWQLEPWNELYDLFLVYGPYQRDLFEKKFNRPGVMIGYPRYDSFFNNSINKQEILNSLGCESNKKTIVWLPTWGKASSIFDFASTFSNLSKIYNVIVKCHPGVMSREPEKWSFLKSFSYTRLIETIYDNVFLFKAADFIFSDYGGVPFGAIYTDKNLFLLDVDVGMDNQDFHENSPDLRLRDCIPHISKNEVDTIGEKINDKNLWNDQKLIRKALRDLYFMPSQGISASSAATILKNLRSIKTYTRKSFFKNLF